MLKQQDTNKSKEWVHNKPTDCELFAKIVRESKEAAL